jgi:hypothetical protein
MQGPDKSAGPIWGWWQAWEGICVRAVAAMLGAWGRMAAAADKIGADKRRGEAEV